MEQKVMIYKCPSCNAPLHFDEDQQKLVCDHCNNTYDPKAFDEQGIYRENKKKKSQTADNDYSRYLKNDWGEDASLLYTYSCPTCGGALICEKESAVSKCIYCGNPSVITEKFSGGLKPNYIIPFKVSREDAINALHGHYSNKKLLPRVFKKENHIQEVKGIYVPYWMYKGKVDAKMEYNAYKSNIKHSSDGNTMITDTDYYHLYREGYVTFSGIPEDASAKLHDALMDSIEPYNYSELEAFTAAYIPGFMADMYDVDAKKCEPRARQRAMNTAKEALKGNVGGFTVTGTVKDDRKLNWNQVSYALLPVWVLTTNWRGNNYVFAMNGQTGKLVGDLPLDERLYLGYRLLYTGLFGGILSAIFWLLLKIFN